MYGQGIKAYAQVDLESQLAGATPHQLISMLFDGAHNAILRAKIYFENGNIAKRGEMISKAINIIDNGLRSALDHEQGKEIAQELEMLYEYMSRTLLECNMRNNPDKLTHVDELLMSLANTWKEIEPSQKQVRHG
ncbi:flagellar export chaperone FliS [Citrobacter amalonaticus]|uniref:Flagellar secretion chaperone FliS n=1 Tax=Citrobacter amalonaticus TaxID=35703 RepID=A0A2S4RPT6_CITAM|nr:flagellar export chaperone FliS [Citrobacter amalonaticus]POT54762.1 flagellar export chaperone FliS [Citrobacter amalonaticus]POT68934.1 flagellar export chaperone FliS [Citrobacter amalonaticus]POU59072.1 flagellar export chaperone FliS [Citrobacter amalonaticus]POV02306.1 flagellar export chaperone FliS [Citrobacter amalonaticus]